MLTKDVPAVCWVNTDFCSAVDRPVSTELSSQETLFLTFIAVSIKPHVEFLFNGGIFLSLQMVTLWLAKATVQLQMARRNLHQHLLQPQPPTEQAMLRSVVTACRLVVTPLACGERTTRHCSFSSSTSLLVPVFFSLADHSVCWVEVGHKEESLSREMIFLIKLVVVNWWLT